MKMTKTLAENLTAKILEKEQELLKLMEADLSKKAFDIVFKSLPESIGKLVLNKNLKGYFTERSKFQFIGCGFNHDYVALSEGLPYDNSRTIQLDDSNASHKELFSLYQIIKSKKSELSDLKTKFEAILYSLRTTNNVEKQFPELAKYLVQENVSNNLPANISELSEFIKLNVS